MMGRQDEPPHRRMSDADLVLGGVLLVGEFSFQDRWFYACRWYRRTAVSIGRGTDGYISSLRAVYRFCNTN
jgi:hypothetical protein